MKFLRFWIGGLFVVLMLFFVITRWLLVCHLKVFWTLFGTPGLKASREDLQGFEVVNQAALKKFGG